MMSSIIPFFSIIMPVYNSEKYVGKAINSILKQSFRDFELIIVDDGSSDSSKDICGELALTDHRIILKETKDRDGVANVRNEGLKWVRGEYVTFVDSDDFIDNDIFELAYIKIKSYRPDVLKYACIEEYYNEFEHISGTKDIHLTEQYLEDQKAIRQKIIELEKLPLFGYVWNAFYCTKVLKEYGVQFDTELSVSEDFNFNLLFFNNVKKLYCLDKCAYHYAKRMNNSLSTKKNEDYYKIHFLKIKSLLEYYEKWNLLDNCTEQRIFWLYTRGIYSTISRKIEDGENYIEILQQIFTTPLHKKFTMISSSGLSFKEKLLMNELKKEHRFTIYLLCLLMNLIRNKLRIIFSRIKG